MIVLAIDPGLASVGYGVVKQECDKEPEILAYGCIRTKVKQTKECRLNEIFKAVSHLVVQQKPDCLAIEKVYFAKNAKTALTVGEGRGIILLIAGMSGLPVAEFTPLQVKQTMSGFGRASKSQIQEMVKRVFRLSKIPSSDDAADALAIAYTYLQHAKFFSRTS
jgi:crossover junction endodeoxyribonuclease RuvC